MPITPKDRELLQLAQDLNFKNPWDAVVIVQYSETPALALRELAESGKLQMRRAPIEPDPPRIFL